MNREAISYDYLKQTENRVSAFEMAAFFGSVAMEYQALPTKPASFIDYAAARVVELYGRPLPDWPATVPNNTREVTDRHALPGLLAADESLSALAGLPVQKTLLIDDAAPVRA